MLKQLVSLPERVSELPRGIEWACAAGALGFLVLSVWFVREVSLAVAAGSWPSVTGRITEMERVAAGGRTGSGGFRLSPVYEYSVDGVSFKGSGFGPGFLGLGDGFEEASRPLRQKGPVTVYYQPGNPSRSALWNKGTGVIAWLMTIGWVIGFFLFSYAFLWIRRSRSASPAP